MRDNISNLTEEIQILRNGISRQNYAIVEEIAKPIIIQLKKEGKTDKEITDSLNKFVSIKNCYFTPRYW